MRGPDIQQEKLFSYLSLKSRVPQTHPLRPIRIMADKALKELSPIFRELYSRIGRPSIPPEQLLRSLLLQILYLVRSERILAEQLDDNLLFRWFVGLSMDETIWNHSVYSKNRERILHSDLAVMFLRSICSQALAAGLLSGDHFTVDDTLIKTRASLKSFRPKDKEPPISTGGNRNPEVDFHGEKCCNDTHVSVTDPKSRLFRKGKGKEAKLCFMGHVLMENRNGLAVDTRATQATGTAERGARYKGEEKIDWLFTLSAAACNMVRMRSLGVVASG